MFCSSKSLLYSYSYANIGLICIGITISYKGYETQRHYPTALFYCSLQNIPLYPCIYRINRHRSTANLAGLSILFLGSSTFNRSPFDKTNAFTTRPYGRRNRFLPYVWYLSREIHLFPYNKQQREQEINYRNRMTTVISSNPRTCIGNAMPYA